VLPPLLRFFFIVAEREEKKQTGEDAERSYSLNCHVSVLLWTLISIFSKMGANLSETEAMGNECRPVDYLHPALVRVVFRVGVYSQYDFENHLVAIGAFFRRRFVCRMGCDAYCHPG
jgi:hypothetical protein